MKSKLTLALMALTYSGASLAHPGHADGAMAGLMHPLTGADHILAILAVGLWGAQLGGRAQWILPASFVCLLAAGGALGMSGIALPMVEAGILASVLLLGLLIGFAVKLKTQTTDNSGHTFCALLWNSPMEIKVNFLDKLRLEAKFDDFTVIADQPIRYKGDGSAPGPFDYFPGLVGLVRGLFREVVLQHPQYPDRKYPPVAE
jgi:hypothetical protein